MSLSYSNRRELAEGNLPALLFRYSWPALVAMTLNALYAVVDRIFIGQGCGVDSMAAITLVMPVMMFFGAFGVFIGAGHAAVLSIKLGEGAMQTCERLLGQLVVLKVLFFSILAPLVYLNLDTILIWCGAGKVTPGTFMLAKEYLSIVVFSHVFSHLAFGLSAMQRAEGSVIKSMNSLVVGFSVNLLLDPVFIFLFGMGVKGAAFATNVAMLSSAICAVGYYLKGDTVVRLRMSNLRIWKDLLLKPFAIGLSPFVQQLMSSLIIISLQIAFTSWIDDETARTNQIASLGVFHASLILILMPILGCQQGLQPIFGYNWGARNFARVYLTFKCGLAATWMLCFAAFVVQVVPPFPGLIAKMFISSGNPEVLSLATSDLQLSNCMIFCAALNIVSTTYFQSIGRPLVALTLSLLRQGLVLLPAIWFLPYLFDDKPFAIWLAMPLADVVCFVATFIPLYFHRRFLTRVKSREAVRFSFGSR